MIHSTAVVDPKAELGKDVSIGPYSVVGPDARLGDGVRLASHVVIDGKTTLGEKTEVLPFAMVGAPPGDVVDRGEGTELVIGARVSIREHVSLHRGSNKGTGKTEIGDDCVFLAHSHVGHDCILEKGVLMTNASMLAGHVFVEDHAVIGGNAAVHQFCRVGARAMIGGNAAVRMDVPPYCLATGVGPRLFGINVVGLRRSRIPKESIRALREAYRILFQKPLERKQAASKVKDQFGSVPEVRHLLEFIDGAKRGIPRHGRGD